MHMPAEARSTFPPKSTSISRSVPYSSSALAIDVGLPDALRLGREVLFASEAGAAYVAIDAAADAEVRARLFAR